MESLSNWTGFLVFNWCGETSLINEF
jgi:hypothetical protein